ncbi:hypothetical protein J41TS12_21240 [Paenibacillus antibioticophila]|uniref:Uncharacterized protein n=1 Tax=Paenibacillus antibioticophila TaxID=1274374 RepID=A0A919XVL0_9BACL|nr:hypothetical protein [Paenibacillus antibioticophila]GIO37263.1 hypothetical protein J41TS12_21240 [Paenibacillus antibioticophila]
MLWEMDEIIIGGNKYTIDHDTNSIRRFNEKSKMWVNVTFGNEEGVADKLIRNLTDEYIKQCLENEKSPT